MRASYLLEAKYVCVHAKKGKYECEAESSYGAAKKAAEHWGLKGTSGIDAHLADKPKTATEGIEGMTPNTQVRGIMPKQRKPYHKHKIKSDHEPETDLSERGVDDVGQKIYKGNTTRVVHTPVADKNISVADKRMDKFASDRARDDLTYTGAKITMPGTNQAIAKAQNNIKQAYNKQDKIDQRSGAGTSFIKKGKPVRFDPANSASNVKIAMDSEMDEYDPRRVKANVMKHLVDMYNDAKKDDGYSSEEMRFALGNLLHDMDMAGYMNSDYFDIEGFFHKGIDVKADEKINMGMLKKAYKQAKNLPDDTSVDPDIFTRGGSAMKSVATEDNPLPKEFFRTIASSNNPHDEIEGLMRADGPAGDYIRRDYEMTAGENGLHPDDDFEEVLDIMVANYEDRTFEGTKNNTSMLGEVVKELTEEEFDEAAGKKDACYRKVKSRYKVWPSAYASGALVKCRKVGAANWGNKSKK